jgi:hypothetical protein
VILLLLLLATPAMAAQEVTSTRTTLYDWQCQDAAGVQVSNHAREGTAITACANKALADGKTYYVQGGRYRITATTAIPAPPVPVLGTAQLTWSAPTANTDGTPIVGTLTYKVYHGLSAAALTDVVPVTGLTYTYGNLASGTHYFAVSAVSAAGESAKSSVKSKVVP